MNVLNTHIHTHTHARTHAHTHTHTNTHFQGLFHLLVALNVVGIYSSSIVLNITRNSIITLHMSTPILSHKTFRQHSLYSYMPLIPSEYFKVILLSHANTEVPWEPHNYYVGKRFVIHTSDIVIQCT